MNSTLLKSKLSTPIALQKLVPRPRLIEQLNEGVHGKLILVSAPAGFGKTTLVSEWLADSDLPHAWISLDENDNELERFLSYFVVALQQIDSTIGRPAGAVHRSSQLPDAESLITGIVNDISSMESSFILVLDDYHFITTQPIHESVGFLIEHIPTQMHLLISSRSDPPINLSRLRASRSMWEIRGADLRFTEMETEQFFKQSMNIELSADAVKTLEERTEGWIAGLQLAALSMRSLEDVDRQAFIDSLAGTDRYILDYLVEEVLDKQPRHVQDFLLQTSILDDLYGPLCDAVLGRGEHGDSSVPGKKMLENLEQNNLFIIPLDRERNWYRYHHLFAELLLNQLKSSQPEIVPLLHQRASVWFSRNDRVPEAIVHSLAAKDWARSAQLIEITMHDMMSRGEYYTTMLGRLRALPEGIVRARPHLAVSYAWLLSILLRLDEVEPRLREIEETGGAELSDEIKLDILVIRASQARLQRDFIRARELSFEALEALPENDSDDNPLQREARTGVVFNLGFINLFHTGDMVEAENWFSKALSICEAAGSVTLTLGAMDGYAQCQYVKGKLGLAIDTYARGLDLAARYRREGGKEIPAASYAHIGLGNLLREKNRLAEASDHLRTGIELCREWQMGDVLCNGYLYQARLKQALCDFEGAMESIRKAEQLKQVYRIVPRNGGPIAACRARLLLIKGISDNGRDLSQYIHRVQKWSEERELKLNRKTYSMDSECEHLVWARLLLAQGRHREASQLLKAMLESAEDNGRTGRAIEILVLNSLAEQMRGEGAQSLNSLKRALDLAEPEGYVRLFLDEGMAMKKLLRRAASSGISTDYVAQLLDAFEKDAVRHKSESRVSPSTLLEPLSDREVEVFRLLIQDLSGPSIADELFISLNTVKTHIKAIYDKLNVHSRHEAIQLAQKHNLLD